MFGANLKRNAGKEKKNDTIKPKSISVILAAQDTSLSSKKEASR